MLSIKKIIANNKENVGKQDRDRISLTEDYKVLDRSKKIGITPAELRQAVKQVGSVSNDVEVYLKIKR